MERQQTKKTRILVECAMMIAIATALNVVCSWIPFLNLPFGGGFTICSMLPIVLAAYRNGTKWGLLTGFVYAVVQMLLGFKTVSAFFMPGDEQMVIWKALLVCFIDYIVAYTVLGLGGIFKNKIKNPAVSLCCGSIVALALRYLAHTISGFLFFGTWAEWFFTQDGFPAFGAKIVEFFGENGVGLSLFYSIFYNGLYMIPEIIITAVVALAIGNIPQINGKKKA